MTEQLVGTTEDLGPGSVRGIGDWAVLNVDGERYAVSRRCRHLRADLAKGEIDENGCLVCPWHQSRYDPTTGRMVVGPQAGLHAQHIGELIDENRENVTRTTGGGATRKKGKKKTR